MREQRQVQPHRVNTAYLCGSLIAKLGKVRGLESDRLALRQWMLLQPLISIPLIALPAHGLGQDDFDHVAIQPVTKGQFATGRRSLHFPRSFALRTFAPSPGRRPRSKVFGLAAGSLYDECLHGTDVHRAFEC